MLYCGSCHCGAVAFEVEAGFLHLIVPKRDFKLLRGADALTTCTFKKKAKVDYLAHIEQLHSCATMASGAYCGLSVELLV